MEEAHPGHHVEEYAVNQFAVHLEKEIVQAVVQAAQFAGGVGVSHEIIRGHTIAMIVIGCTNQNP